MPAFTRTWRTDENFTTYRVRHAYQTVGYVRRPDSRSVARDMGIPFRWAWTSGEGNPWNALAGDPDSSPEFTRIAAATALLNANGIVAEIATRRVRARSARSAGRVFGIEMELTGPSPSTIIRALTDAGIRMAARNLATMAEVPYTHTNTESNVWTLKHDGSVSGYALELVSPKLSGTAGFEAVRTVCAALKEVGATVDRTCGLHVHHDFRGMPLDDIRTQVVAFIERQEAISRLVAPSRRRNGYAPRWQDTDLANLRAARHPYQLGIGPRGNINLHAFGVHGSVEIRAHGGTTNANKIIAWVKFGQALFAAAAAGFPIDTEPEEMLSDLLQYGLDASDAARLLRFENLGVSREQVEARLLGLREQLVDIEELLEEVSA